MWDLEIADFKFGYYISVTPLVVKDKLILGMSNDQSDIAGFLEARSPADGKVLWHWDATPKPGEPGSETWPNADAAAHGGGATWIPGSYDPELNLIYWGTGNPHPVLAGKVRPGSNCIRARSSRCTRTRARWPGIFRRRRTTRRIGTRTRAWC